MPCLCFFLACSNSLALAFLPPRGLCTSLDCIAVLLVLGGLCLLLVLHRQTRHVWRRLMPTAARCCPLLPQRFGTRTLESAWRSIFPLLAFSHTPALSIWWRRSSPANPTARHQSVTTQSSVTTIHLAQLAQSPIPNPQHSTSIRILIRWRSLHPLFFVSHLSHSSRPPWPSSFHARRLVASPSRPVPPSFVRTPANTASQPQPSSAICPSLLRTCEPLFYTDTAIYLCILRPIRTDRALRASPLPAAATATVVLSPPT